MSGRPSRMTLDVLTVFEHQFSLRSQVITLKQLAVVTGYSPTYCHQVMKRLAKGGKFTVPRETNKVEEAWNELREIT